jgi:multidrug efflux pump subunit AcrA (membrane-fusion protein)
MLVRTQSGDSVKIQAKSSKNVALHFRADAQSPPAKSMTYLTRPRTKCRRWVKDHIKAGMPVEVMVPAGERTVISYLVRPLGNRANSAFREK